MNPELNTVDAATIRRHKEKIVDQYGEWTSYNVQLADDLYTIDPARVSPKLRRVLQIVADVAGRPLEGLRVLDLGCLEGEYAIEMARHGATAVGIEGREANLAKARFVKDVFGLDGLELVQDDFRNLSREAYGQFDVVLCLGILYHLDAPDVFRFVEAMHAVCRRALIIDTYISVADKEAFPDAGRTYYGRSVAEHDPRTTPEQRLASLWSSLDNVRSVWLTRPSLLNLLAHVGFTSVYECHVPAEPRKPADRITLVALKGQRTGLLSTPAANQGAGQDWPERPTRKINAVQKWNYDINRHITALIPRRLKGAIKAVLRSMGIGPKAAARPWEWAQPWRRKGR